VYPHVVALSLFALFLSGCGFVVGAASRGSQISCAAPGQWSVLGPDGARRETADTLLARLAKEQVVLLGETHDDAEHHRWQLHTVAGLYALQPRMVLGFEMFPRRVQGVLDDWVAGRLGDAEFLGRVEWRQVWGYDPDLYLPLFQFARMHRIPMLALNVERRLVSRVGEVGWAAIPEAEREGVGDPAPASREYATWLYQSYLDHQPPGGRQSAERRQPTDQELTDARFRRFVEAMQVWDRAMAQGIADRLRGGEASFVVAIMGSGHLRHGHGVPRQLRDLGVTSVAVALPWDATEPCAALVPGLADAVFGIEARPRPRQPERPRLGISIDAAPEGVRVISVVPASLAEQAGIRPGDVIVRVAGEPATRPGDVVEAVLRQAPGTWLPITVKRGEATLDLVARFPPRP
jgi:uncharacterized iron-regulated protein